MMPNKSMILEKAIELFHIDRTRANEPSFDITPTETELKENGYFAQAVSQLLRDNTSHAVQEWQDYAITEQTEFSFDLDLAIQQGIFVSGGRGCGKSSLTKTIVNRLLKRGYVIRVFDNSQTWRNSSVPNLAVIEPYTTFKPEYNLSYVMDTSLMSIKEQKEFIENLVSKEFIKTAKLSEKERNWRIYVFEECELLLGTHEKSKELLKLCAVGRNFKMSYIAIAQRFQMVSTNMISLCGQIFLGQCHEQNDLKKAYNWLGDKTKELTKLDVGQFIRYCKGESTKMNVDLFTTEIKPKIITTEKPKTEIMPMPKTTPQTDSYALAKLLIITALGILILLLGVR
jgi:energy-coupling factor transporter ATP-binding protein EcfA2